MIRTLIGSVLVLCLTNLQAMSEQTYWLNPQAVQKAMSKCPQTPPTDISCDKLKSIASHINQLGNALRADPQGFGLKILRLQETIASQQDAVKSSDINTSLLENQQRLSEYLAIVKWLESPGR